MAEIPRWLTEDRFLSKLRIAPKYYLSLLRTTGLIFYDKEWSLRLLQKQLFHEPSIDVEFFREFASEALDKHIGNFNSDLGQYGYRREEVFPEEVGQKEVVPDRGQVSIAEDDPWTAKREPFDAQDDSGITGREIVASKEDPGKALPVKREAFTAQDVPVAESRDALSDETTATALAAKEGEEEVEKPPEMEAVPVQEVASPSQAIEMALENALDKVMFGPHAPTLPDAVGLKAALKAEFRDQLANLAPDIDERVQARRKPKSKMPQLNPRDTVLKEFYHALLNLPPTSICKKRSLIKQARLRIVFTLLYYLGLRANELKGLTYADLKGAIEQRELQLSMKRQDETVVRHIPRAGVEALKKRQGDMDLLFKEHTFQYLGESLSKPGALVHEKAWIASINKEMQRGGLEGQEDLNLSSHSFRTNFVTQGEAKGHDSATMRRLIGHNNIATT